jgi:hypothetical protein
VGLRRCGAGGFWRSQVFVLRVCIRRFCKCRPHPPPNMGPTEVHVELALAGVYARPSKTFSTSIMPYLSIEDKREYQRRWWNERRATAMASRGNRCEACGGLGPFEFHHRDPSQKLSHRIWSWAKTRLEAELAKCDMLCLPCHDSATVLPPRDPLGRFLPMATVGCALPLSPAFGD